MAKIESQHWWFVARRKIISHTIQKLSLKTNLNILEIGCGTGGNFKMLSKFGKVSAIEPNKTAQELLKLKGYQDILNDYLSNGIDENVGQFDLIVLLDVLEHIDDDKRSLEKIRTLLKKDGHLLITVPAFSWLWSKHDELHHHKRRYNKTQFNQLLCNSGYFIEKISYFNVLLFPIIVLMRLLTHISADKKLPNWLNKVLAYIFSLERYLIRKKM